MHINDQIVKDYINGKPPHASHWVYRSIEDGKTNFVPLPPEHGKEVEDCYRQILKVCDRFHFLNENLINGIMNIANAAVQNAKVLLTVHIPPPYDAMVREHDGQDNIIIDVGNICAYIAQGYSSAQIVQNFLTHELIHVIINEKYPRRSFTYTEELNYIAFHEGFAHLLSFHEDILNYRPDESFKDRFAAAKMKLITALHENDPAKQKQYLEEADSGPFWNKFAAIASMLFLMKHGGELKLIYDAGWEGFAYKVCESHS